MNNYLIPNHIAEYNIYDIFYNSDNKLIIISPFIRKPYIINYILNNDEILTFNLYKSHHEHLYIYSLDVEYNEIIELNINNNIIKTHVNKYPVFKDEIIFSTIVKNEDNYIKQWIDFHLNLGISRFIIYDNSNEYKLSQILAKYIENNQVILIHWPYPYRTFIGGLSGQATHQNHSIYAFRNSKYIGLFDIDEYINIQEKKQNINDFFEELIIKENININEISSFRLLNKFFYNPYNLPTDGNNFLRIFNCDNIDENCHQKCFAIPKNIKIYSIHMVIDGYSYSIYDVNKKYVFFNHYYFLNKDIRGRNKTDLIDKSILLHINNDDTLNEQPLDLVSVIIPTFNRFESLINTIESIKEQTYKNIEIIVINNCSTEKEYYEYNWEENNIIIIHLEVEESSKKKYSFNCGYGYHRNFGLEIAKGKYVAFADDCGIWFPLKLELQINAMKDTRCKMSSTDGLFGHGIYNKNISYPKYNAQYYYNDIQNIFQNKKSNLLNNGFPNIWDLKFMLIHNCIIPSSVIIEKEIIILVGKFNIANYDEEYNYWLRALTFTDNVYINDSYIYYNAEK